MSAEFPTLAEVVAEHRWTGGWITDGHYGATCACGWEDITNTHRTGLQLHGEHVEQVWREACTIRTRAVLDALTTGSVVRELDHPVPGFFELQELDESDEPATAWYVVGDGWPTKPRLPALLLAHPDWAQS